MENEQDRENEAKLSPHVSDRQPVGGPTDAKAWISKLQSVFAQTMRRDPLAMLRMTRMAVDCLYRDPKLQRCDQLSFSMALMSCAEMGLFPSSVTAQAYLVPFNDKNRQLLNCVLIPGYQGLVHCAYRHPRVASIYSTVVREGDEFEEIRGTERGIVHRPLAPWGAPMTHAYSVCEISGKGRPIFYVLTASEAEDVMRRSQAGKRDLERIQRGEHGSSPWTTDPEAMWMKSAFKRLQKWIPKSWSLMRALEVDAKDEDNSGVGRTFELQTDSVLKPSAQMEERRIAAPEERLEEQQMKTHFKMKKVAVKAATVPSEAPKLNVQDPGEEPTPPDGGEPEAAPRVFVPISAESSVALRARYEEYRAAGGNPDSILERPIEELSESDAKQLIARFEQRTKFRKEHT